jgi:hypothetical protein
MVVTRLVNRWSAQRCAAYRLRMVNAWPDMMVVGRTKPCQEGNTAMPLVMKWTLTIAEVTLFALAAAAIAGAAERPLNVVHLRAERAANCTSPYTPAQAVSGPAQLVARTSATERILDVRPARESDLFPSADRVAHYQQPSYPEITTLARPIAQSHPSSAVHQANYAASALPSRAPTTYAGPVTRVQYAPAPAYTAPQYAAPVIGVPHTVYSPVAPLTPVRADVQVGRGIYGQPVIYRPGQPLRNAWRWLTP